MIDYIRIPCKDGFTHIVVPDAEVLSRRHSRRVSDEPINEPLNSQVHIVNVTNAETYIETMACPSTSLSGLSLNSCSQRCLNSGPKASSSAGEGRILMPPSRPLEGIRSTQHDEVMKVTE